MTLREIRASGFEAVLLASQLLQRNRNADPTAGLWEAADRQWWWRLPRASDEIDQLFWVDDDGPVATAQLTSWKEQTWQCDPLRVAGATAPSLDELWAASVEQIEAHVVGRIEVPVRDDDVQLQELVAASGLTPGDGFTNCWLDASERPDVSAAPDGFTVVDRTERVSAPHPMRHRNGDAVEERLRQTPLYDPALDLSVEAPSGQVAGYILFWLDPATRTGLVEPVRVEDVFARRGLARTMLSHGLDRLAERGAQRIKVGYMSEAAGALYRSVGFRPTTTDTTYAGTRPAA